MTSSTESFSDEGFEPGSSADFWYNKAVQGHRTFDGNKGKFLTQAGLWLMEEDLKSLSLAWDLVMWEKEAADAEDLG